METQISIITTVKDGEHYLYEMLNSVLNQTFKKYECIIIDDGSRDNTLNILKDYQTEHPGFPLCVISQDIMGRGRALNFAVSKAKSEWIAILDADDLWHPEKLKIQIEEISKNDFSVIATESVSFTGEVFFNSLNKDNSLRELKLDDFLVNNPVCHSSVLIKKEVCLYDESRQSQFDCELWLRLLSKNYRIGIIPQKLTYHRKHDKQSFEAKMGKSMFFNSFKLKAAYSLRYGHFFSLAQNFIRLLYVYFLPVKLKLLLKRRSN